ncbi:hypothetical protein OF001_U170092 [Pseudomonas sp. OF001]|nr:hypothetical protein OF001_U170092 [Pseudomonas sp. OF001]
MGQLPEPGGHRRWRLRAGLGRAADRAALTRTPGNKKPRSVAGQTGETLSSFSVRRRA